MAKLTNEELADELVVRLNKLVEDSAVREDVCKFLLKAVMPASPETQKHPTIKTDHRGEMSFMGLLNGIVGSVPLGSTAGWGLITAVFGYPDSRSSLVFRREHAHLPR